MLLENTTPAMVLGRQRREIQHACDDAAVAGSIGYDCGYSHCGGGC